MHLVVVVGADVRPRVRRRWAGLNAHLQARGPAMTERQMGKNSRLLVHFEFSRQLRYASPELLTTVQPVWPETIRHFHQLTFFRPLAYFETTWPNFAKYSLHVACGTSWLGCAVAVTQYVICHCGFAADVMFARNTAGVGNANKAYAQSDSPRSSTDSIRPGRAACSSL